MLCRVKFFQSLLQRRDNVEFIGAPIPSCFGDACLKAMKKLATEGDVKFIGVPVT